MILMRIYGIIQLTKNIGEMKRATRPKPKSVLTIKVKNSNNLVKMDFGIIF